MQAADLNSRDPTLFSAVWRYKWLVLGWLVLVVAAAAVFVVIQPPTFEATALLVIEDTTTPGVSEGGARSEQFVRDRVAIIESETVARRASVIASADGTVTLTSDEVLSQQEVRGFEGSDLIVLRFEADTPDAAIAGANAIAIAYEDLLREEAARATQRALENIDAALEKVATNLAQIQRDISVKRAEDPNLAALDLQLNAAMAELVELQDELAGAVTEEQRDSVRARLSDIRAHLDTFSTVEGVRPRDPELSALERSRQDAISRQATLASQRTEVELEGQIASTGVALNTPAESADESALVTPGRAVAIALILGGLSGAAIAYALASRQRAFTDRSAPEKVLGAPLLAEIPEFGDEGLDTSLPVRDAPRSASAEAFRFAAVTLDITMAASGFRSVVFVSPILGSGKTTTVANTAIAAAREGRRVVVIDADFGNQAVTRMLKGKHELVGVRGMTDITDPEDLHDVLWSVSLGDGIKLSLLGRGTRPLVAADYFRAPSTRQLFEAITGEFDLVLIDCPPLLQVAYASTLIGFANAVVVVVAHDSQEAELVRAADRLTLIGRPVTGYLYNRAPLRREMTASEGSLADILGDTGMDPSDRSRRTRKATGR